MLLGLVDVVGLRCHMFSLDYFLVTVLNMESIRQKENSPNYRSVKSTMVSGTSCFKKDFYI